MKNALIASLALIGLTAAPALADDPRPADHPCRKIEDACKAAGFVKGEAKVGKGLFIDCLDPIVAGKTVPNVTVDPSLGPACKAREAEARKHPKAP